MRARCCDGRHPILVGLVGMLVVMLAMTGRCAESVTCDEHRLTDVSGKEWSLAEMQTPYIVVAFLGTECPLARLYAPRLEQLSRKYADRGVAFLGVNSNRQDSLADIRVYQQQMAISFDLLKDLGHQLADTLGAQRTPEVFLLDRQRKVCYRGRIDDQYGVGYSRPTAHRHDLAMAIDELLAGQPVTVARTTAVGCHIGRVRNPTGKGDVTYHQHIQPLFRKHCVECHQPGEIGPFALTDYDEVVGWAETIHEVVQDRRMPPWHANPKHGSFLNERFLSDQEKDLLRRWVEAGAPRGKPGSNVRPDAGAPVSRSVSWRPDVTIKMRERPFQVAAEGTVAYQYFVVDPGFKEDKWVSHATVVPGNRSVVHHAIVFVRPPDSERVRGIGWLAAYVPGQMESVLPSGFGRRIPAGSKLVFQMHYTPVGSVVEDQTRLQMKFADPATVHDEVVTMLVINREFEIPPGVSNFREEAQLDRFPTGSRLLAMAPHMHVRGKSFRFLHQREGEERILLDVPAYDFNWQHVYRMRAPLELKPGDRLQCVAHYDNSSGNPVNPDPTATVRWGDQTWEEMLIGYCMVAMPRDARPEVGVDHQLERLAEEKARRFIKEFDRDGDGRVQRNEVPTAVANFGFRQVDRNRDGAISFREATTNAARTLRGKK